MDLVQAAHKAVGVNLTLEAVPLSRGLAKIKEGLYAGVFNAGINEEVTRDKLISRSPVAVSQQVVVARLGQEFKGLRSFNGRRLVLANGFTYPARITGDPGNSIHRAVSEINGLRMIAAGRGDFTIIDRFVLQSLRAQDSTLRTQVGVVGVLDLDDRIHVLVARNAKGGRAKALFDEGMEAIERNGVKRDIVERRDGKIR